jgi:hypothetical protein
MEECRVDGCKNLRSNGDELFCFKCRAEWKEICNGNFGAEKQASEEDVIYLLGRFLKGKALGQVKCM